MPRWASLSVPRRLVSVSAAALVPSHLRIGKVISALFPSIRHIYYIQAVMRERTTPLLQGRQFNLIGSESAGLWSKYMYTTTICRWYICKYKCGRIYLNFLVHAGQNHNRL